MGALLQLGFVSANIIRTLSWKTVQKRFPKVTKSLFNQIKKIWASLPGSGHGQPEVKMTRIKKIYDKLLQEELGATS